LKLDPRSFCKTPLLALQEAKGQAKLRGLIIKNTMEKQILITNDDGIYAPGLLPLIKEMRKIGKVHIVVPNQEKSGVSHALTLDRPLRAFKIRNGIDELKEWDGMYVVNGTPADCVRLSILSLFKRKIDLVVSGINRGANLGEDVIYSATVAAAREASMLGIPGLAVSLLIKNGQYFSTAAKYAYKVSKWILKNGLSPGIFFNLNVPDLPERKIKTFVVTRLGKRIYSEKIDSRRDPRGLKYYWLAGKAPSGINEPGTDISALNQKTVSLTPLKYNPTAEELIPVLKDKFLSTKR